MSETREQGILAVPSDDADDLARDPHLREPGTLREASHTDTPVGVAGNPIELSGSPDSPTARWPHLGEHTDAILTGDLSLSAAELRSLREEGVIGAQGGSTLARPVRSHFLALWDAGRSGGGPRCPMRSSNATVT